MPSDKENMNLGKVRAVHGPVVDVAYDNEGSLPAIYEILRAETYDGQEVILEVVEHRSGNIARTVSLTPTYGLARNSAVRRTGKPLSIPRGEAVLGRVVNVLGEPIDKKGPIKSDETFAVQKTNGKDKIELGSKNKADFEIIETGLKMIDLLFPLVKNT
ncbi:MAG TPA: F0F1 ATP synthase subunit beta, partial [Candidatus Omnitrophota bacterium]|nr:F0F1 ATP synthase subunit beta [Candidatus Omnitrophota bacterium]